MKKIYLTKSFKIVAWIAVVAIGVWGYWQFSGGGSGNSFFGDSASISEVSLGDATSPPTLSDTTGAGVLVPGAGGGDAGSFDPVGSDDGVAALDSSAAPSSPDDSSATNSTELNDSSGASAQNSSLNAPAEDQSSQVEAQIPVQAPAQVCSLADANPSSPSREVIFNEIAWMGSPPESGETAAKAGEREWIELENVSSGTVDVSGWQILDSAGELKITSSTNTKIAAGGFYLLVRDGAALAGVSGSGAANSSDSGAAITPDAGYSGGLSNAGDKLALFDANCDTADFLDASGGWPGGNNTTKQTLERDADGVGWHTSVSPGGTPRAENSVPASAPAAALTASSTSPSPIFSMTIASSVPAVSSAQYPISVSLVGAGSGTVSSTPAGIVCGFQCEANFSAGTKMIFGATAEPGSVFKGWSGACGGSAVAGITVPSCSFTLSGSAAVVAEFDPIEAEASATIENGSLPAPAQNPAAHLLIAAIQIGGASSSNDFVKIFNPTGVAVDLTGWKLHKKSSTGTDYSLKTFVAGNTIAPGGYFEWANSEGGFADSIGADASSTETLSADNSVALFDANGNIVDQVAWGTGTDQYVEGAAYPTDPTAGQVLMRQSAGGVMADSDNNANDFAIQ